MSRRDKLFDLPIYKKAELILDLVNSLLNTISEEDEYLNATKYMMRDDAAIICAKIAGAEGGDMYSIRMQNAAIIRDHAMHLYVQVGSLRFHDSFKDTDYVIKGKLDPNADFITRSAPGLGNNSGGAIEIVTNPNGVKLDSFNMIGE